MLRLIIYGKQLNEILVLKNDWKLDVDNLEINNNLLVPSILDIFFMSLDSLVSRRRRGLSPKINPIAKIGRRNIVLSTQQCSKENFVWFIKFIFLSLTYHPQDDI